MTIKISNRPTVRAGLLMAFAITSSLLSGCETEKQPAGGHSDRQPPASGELMLSDTQIRLANITTRAVRKDAIGQTIVINGKLTVDEQRAHVISSRAGGRIEKLFFKETGQVINAGEPVYVLYSESLLTLQQEYLLAKEQFQSLGQTEKRYASFFEAAERKLLLYGLSRNQIRQLDKSSLQPRITFLSPASGIVTDINVSEGQYVAEGTMLYRLQDVRKLWVEAELYPHETRLVRTGDRVTVKIGGADEERIEAIVSFMSPEYRTNSQVTIMRASIDNPRLKLKPGQPAQVYLTHSTRQAVAVPTDAVIRDGKGAHVYILTARNTFRPQMVKTGIEGFEEIEITSGLTEGDTVVATGAYLLYSEIILKHGVDPMASHAH